MNPTLQIELEITLNGRETSSELRQCSLQEAE